MYMSMTHFVKLLFQTSIPTQTLNLLVCQVKVREPKLVPAKAFLISGLFVAPPHVSTRGDHFPLHFFVGPFCVSLLYPLGSLSCLDLHFGSFLHWSLFQSFQRIPKCLDPTGHFHDKIQRLSRLFVIALKPWKTVIF